MYVYEKVTKTTFKQLTSNVCVFYGLKYCYIQQQIHWLYRIFYKKKRYKDIKTYVPILYYISSNCK